MYKLDFTKNTAQERCEYIKSQNLSNLTKKELEACANYILWGKDPDGKSPVDKKKVFIKTKYQSWNKNSALSLEELLENPLFDESMFVTIPYKYDKKGIETDKFENNQDFIQLWKTIKNIENVLKKNLDSKTRYHFKHLLIDLRNQQYTLKDYYSPTIQPIVKRFGTYYLEDFFSEMNYPVFPCGTMRFENDDEFMFPYYNNIEFKCLDIDKEIDTLRLQGKRFFNFMDSNHVYSLIVNYSELAEQGKNVNSVIGNLLRTLDFYIDKANLSKQQRQIVDYKKKGIRNRDIKILLEKDMGISHQENYISTIWNLCCRKIANAASTHYDEWCCRYYDKAWKKCSCCGEIKFKSFKNFMKKRTVNDGFSNRCKACDKRIRVMRNGNL